MSGESPLSLCQLSLSTMKSTHIHPSRIENATSTSQLRIQHPLHFSSSMAFVSMLGAERQSNTTRNWTERHGFHFYWIGKVFDNHLMANRKATDSNLANTIIYFGCKLWFAIAISWLCLIYFRLSIRFVFSLLPLLWRWGGRVGENWSWVADKIQRIAAFKTLLNDAKMSEWQTNWPLSDIEPKFTSIKWIVCYLLHKSFGISTIQIKYSHKDHFSDAGKLGKY